MGSGRDRDIVDHAHQDDQSKISAQASEAGQSGELQKAGKGWLPRKQKNVDNIRKYINVDNIKK